MIAQGRKTIETRIWSTNYRGDILIVSSKSPQIDDLPCGQAIAIVELVDCKKMNDGDQSAACVSFSDDLFSWFLKNPRKIKSFSVRGMLGLYDIDFIIS